MSENELINSVASEIVNACDPLNIIIVSNKVNFEGSIVSFKLAVVVKDDTGSIPELEQQLYMKIDCEIPFDIILYKQSEWTTLAKEIGTFAWKFYNTGVYIYGQKL